MLTNCMPVLGMGYTAKYIGKSGLSDCVVGEWGKRKEEKKMYDLLHFRRQFLLSNGLIDELQSWQHRQVGDVHLFAHPDLEITIEVGSSASVLLLGYIFDPVHPEKSNEDIVSDILSRVASLEELLVAIKPYAGRYALLYQDDHAFTILHDPLGIREIYYCTQPNRVICGSQPNLMDAFSDPKLGVTKNKGILHFYKHDMKLVRSGRLWVGDETYYQGVKHLMPNHYLSIRSLTVKRYWPNKRLERIDLDTAVKQSCDYLRGIMKAVTSRFDVMMAVTSGIDSRSLMAASIEIQNRIYYFINKHPRHNDIKADIRIPKDMFKKLNIPFHIHDVEAQVDEEFRKIFQDNVFTSTDLILPVIYNVYYKKHQYKVNLLGVGEIGRDYFGEAPHDLDGYYLARCLKYKHSSYATAQCEKWLQEVRELAKECNVDIMQLFLWEGLLANWGAVGNSESDIAIEEFDPYDSHYIYEIMLSVFRDHGRTGRDEFFEMMFNELWPELLEFPFNPPDTISDWLKNWLQRMGLFHHLKRQRYRLDRWRYNRLINGAQE